MQTLKSQFRFFLSALLLVSTVQLSSSETPPPPKNSSDETVVIQKGPGVAGSLSPLKPSPLVLETEQAIVYLKDDYVEIQGSYSIYNPLPTVHKEKVGIPSLDVAGTKPGDITLKIVQGPVQKIVFSTEIGETVETKEFEGTLPFLEKMSLKRRWYTTTITVPARDKLNLEVRYTVPYLYKKEILKGREDESKRLFQYLRKYTKNWSQPTVMAAIYVKPRVSQMESLAVHPTYQTDKDGTYVYRYDVHTTDLKYDIKAIYDPVFFRVNAFGSKGDRRPATLSEESPQSRYSFAQLFDGDLTTGWCEGERGGGVGSSFEIEWGKIKRIKEIAVFPGASSDESEFRDKNRVKKLGVSIATPGWASPATTLLFEDKPVLQTRPINIRDRGSIAVIQLLDIYPSSQFNDTCLSEIKITFQNE